MTIRSTPEPLRRLCGREGANPCVHADDQPNAGCRGRLDHVVLHAVAFADAVGHVEVGRAAAQFDRRLQNDDGSGAVHVVVAVNQDAFLAFDSGIEALDRRFHSGHQVRGVQIRELRSEISLRRCRVPNSAHVQQSRQRRREARIPVQPQSRGRAQFFRESVDLLLVYGFSDPLHEWESLKELGWTVGRQPWKSALSIWHLAFSQFRNLSRQSAMPIPSQYIWLNAKC